MKVSKELDHLAKETSTNTESQSSNLVFGYFGRSFGVWVDLLFE